MPLDNLDSPLLEPYRDLPHRDRRADDELFFAESVVVVRRLLHSGLRIHSIVLTPNKLDQLRDDLRDDVPTFVANAAQISQLVGFPFNRGVIACAQRPPMLQPSELHAVARETNLAIALENIGDAENIGLLLRSAAAFGVCLVVMSGCQDPYYRRVVRVSMGTVFALRIMRCDELVAALGMLGEEFGFERVATVVGPNAEPLRDCTPASRSVLVFGAEGVGLTAETIAACDRRVTIPMSGDVESLNVAVAAGVLLHHFASRS